MSGELKRVSLEILVTAGMDEVLKDVILEALVEKGMATPSTVKFTGTEEANDIKIGKIKNIVIAHDNVLDKGTAFDIRKFDNADEREKENDNRKYAIIKYKFDKEQRCLVDRGIRKSIKVLDMNDEHDHDRMRSYIGYNSWNIYNVNIVQIKGSNNFQIMVGDKKPGKFALEWIDQEFKKCFELFLNNELENTREDFEKKRDKYFKYFLNKLKKISERPRHIPLFTEFLTAVKNTFYYNNVIDSAKPNIKKIFPLILSQKEMDTYMDFFLDRLNPKDVVQVLDLAGDDYKLTEDNAFYLEEFYIYVYKKIGLLTKNEIHVLRNKNLYPIAIRDIVRSNIWSVAQAVKTFRIKADSWNYQVFRLAWKTIINYQYAYIRPLGSQYGSLDEDQKKMMLHFIKLILKRYATCKEFHICMRGVDDIISETMVRAVQPLIYEALDDIKGNERLTLTSIMNSDVHSPLILGGVKLFETANLSGYNNIKKALLEVKLRRQ